MKEEQWPDWTAQWVAPMRGWVETERQQFYEPSACCPHAGLG